MVFDLQGKVALITGGASGLGFAYAKELLRNGAKGITLADINEKFRETALSQIKEEFGDDKAIFVKTDTTNIKEFEEAFKKTIEAFGHLDILINNAGILNDAIWEKEVAINVNGVIHGMLLGIDNYLPKYKQGEEAVIVNISSTCGVEGYGHLPVYCGTKFAVIGMTKSWGFAPHYDRTKVRVVAVCPGVTHTPLIFDMAGRNLGGPYEKILQSGFDSWLTQDTDHVAKEMVKIINAGPSGTIWIVEGGEPAYEYQLPQREQIARRYLNE
ncbi:hypothetical protein NQ315_001997 [Exocentrus adspersus]|uniref:15-hydroxyprostaglandin dehydrogenase [NAD(+)]-like n=1 Tax=Exocentrus adspersus TaxID=1586481 RepID=A0AAV8WA12_9CUCU|nr:hypothetical protein NQ315_001997 [Exocentrus adspersus]